MIYFLIITVGITLYLVVNTFYVKVNKTEIKAGIKSGLRFVHISDIHGTIRFLNGKLSKLINDISPDFVVVTGDLSSNRKQLPKVLRELESIQAQKGVYVVLGNYEGQELRGFRKIDSDIGETVRQIKSIKKYNIA